MIVSDIADIIEKYAPLNIALPYDNVGLLVGDAQSGVTGVCVALDTTKESLDYCRQQGANVLITHHPLIFDGVKRLSMSDYHDSLVMQAIKEGINIYAAHTNMDDSNVGINYTLADRLSLVDIHRLSDEGGVYGSVDADIMSFAKAVRELTADSCARIYAQHDKVSRVAIISGAGGRDKTLIPILKELNVDTFISGEFKYSVVLDLLGSGINVIDVGHWESERIFIDIVCDILNKENIGVHVVKYHIPPCKLI